jgi:predicted nucleotidyltransferase
MKKVEGWMAELLGRMKTELSGLYGSRLRGIYLFGSRARGEARLESDVDVLIVLDRILGYGAEVDRTGVLVSRLSLEYGVSISRVFVSEEDWKSGESVFLANLREEAVAA